jgi:hypothetical protein
MFVRFLLSDACINLLKIVVNQNKVIKFKFDRCPAKMFKTLPTTHGEADRIRPSHANIIVLESFCNYSQITLFLVSPAAISEKVFEK